VGTLPADRFVPSLPPELRAAALEFEAWAQAQLQVEQNESTPTEPLYYTGEAGLRGILGTQRLRCFRHVHQTDPSELAFSLDIVRQVISEVGQSTDGVTRNFCACLNEVAL
jgi:hypothetical protein